MASKRPNCDFRNQDNTSFCGRCGMPFKPKDLSAAKTIKEFSNELKKGAEIA